MKTYKIYHLDDNPDFFAQMANMFNSIDNISIDYVTFDEREECYKKLDSRERLPHLLIVDLMLEDTWNESPGLDFIEQIRKKFPYDKLGIMVMTSRPDEAIRDKLKGHVQWYETKSFQPSAFKLQIENILTSK